MELDVEALGDTLWHVELVTIEVAQTSCSAITAAGASMA
jgi:hypothetical protein